MRNESWVAVLNATSQVTIFEVSPGTGLPDQTLRVLSFGQPPVALYLLQLGCGGGEEGNKDPSADAATKYEQQRQPGPVQYLQPSMASDCGSNGSRVPQNQAGTQSGDCTNQRQCGGTYEPAHSAVSSVTDRSPIKNYHNAGINKCSSFQPALHYSSSSSEAAEQQLHDCNAESLPNNAAARTVTAALADIGGASAAAPAQAFGPERSSNGNDKRAGPPDAAATEGTYESAQCGVPAASTLRASNQRDLSDGGGGGGVPHIHGYIVAEAQRGKAPGGGGSSFPLPALAAVFERAAHVCSLAANGVVPVDLLFGSDHGRVTAHAAMPSGDLLLTFAAGARVSAETPRSSSGCVPVAQTRTNCSVKGASQRTPPGRAATCYSPVQQVWKSAP